jgi:hypothetical protein
LLKAAVLVAVVRPPQVTAVVVAVLVVMVQWVEHGDQVVAAVQVNLHLLMVLLAKALVMERAMEHKAVLVAVTVAVF